MMSFIAQIVYVISPDRGKQFLEGLDQKEKPIKEEDLRRGKIPRQSTQKSTYFALFFLMMAFVFILQMNSLAEGEKRSDEFNESPQ